MDQPTPSRLAHGTRVQSHRGNKREANSQKRRVHSKKEPETVQSSSKASSLFEPTACPSEKKGLAKEHVNGQLSERQNAKRSCDQPYSQINLLKGPCPAKETTPGSGNYPRKYRSAASPGKSSNKSRLSDSMIGGRLMISICLSSLEKYECFQ